jgi:hypothetical protein
LRKASNFKPSVRVIALRITALVFTIWSSVWDSWSPSTFRTVKVTNMGSFQVSKIGLYLLIARAVRTRLQTKHQRFPQ